MESENGVWEWGLGMGSGNGVWEWGLAMRQHSLKVDVFHCQTYIALARPSHSVASSTASNRV